MRREDGAGARRGDNIGENGKKSQGEEGEGKKRSQGEEGEGEGQEEVPRGGGGTRRVLKGRRGRDKKRSQGEEGTVGGERQVHLTRVQNTNHSHGHHEFLGLFTDHATSLIMP